MAITTFKEFRENVRARADLLREVERDRQVKRAGRVMVCLCPFHEEKTPSFTIWPEEGRWYCFGSCHEGGDVFDFIGKRDGLDHVEAVKQLARENGIEIPQWKEQSPEQVAADELLHMAAQFYHQCLLEQPGAERHREYLQKRGFGEESWRQWMVGAAGDKNGLVAYFKKKQVSLELAAQVGLIHEREEQPGQYFDHFRNRVVIPFLKNGRAVFFTGRAIDGAELKYLHLHNSEYARKTLYGRRGGRDVVIVEGPVDAWAVDLLSAGKVAAIALMGLNVDDPALPVVIKNRERVFIGLDADGTVDRAKIDLLAKTVGPERARLITWPGGDDAAAWWQNGGGDFEALLEGAPSYLASVLERIKAAEDKVPPVRLAVEIAGKLDGLSGGAYISQITAAAKGSIPAKNIREMVATLIRERQSDTAMIEAPKLADGTPENAASPYFVEDGEMWMDTGKSVTGLVAGGVVWYKEIITLDDGDMPESVQVMAIKLRGGREFEARIKSAETGDIVAVTKAIKAVAGPRLTITAGAGRHLIPAIEWLTAQRKMDEITEISRTGWVNFPDGRLSFVSPGGATEPLPEGWRVALPEAGMEHYGVADGGDAAFMEGLEALKLLKMAFPKEISLPLIAYALLPMAEPWLGGSKFGLWLNGETGSLKTETARLLMGLYGDFVGRPPIVSWLSTVNAIERMGWWLPNVLMLIDDYKPVYVPAWDVAQFIHRYADQNGRMRLSSKAEMQRRRSMRCWIISTGEDMPTGEASVLARLIQIRMKRSTEYNAALDGAKQKAGGLPTVAARWARWLALNGEGLKGQLGRGAQKVADGLRKEIPDSPNINRISTNVGMLGLVMGAFREFLIAAGAEKYVPWLSGFGEIAMDVARAQAQGIGDEKPTARFIGTLQMYIDSGAFKLLPLGQGGQGTLGLIGWHDSDGVYILPSAYDDIRKKSREIGQEIQFTRNELYRLLAEEKLLTRSGGKTTVVVVVDIANHKRGRVLHLKPGVLEVRDPDLVTAE